MVMQIDMGKIKAIIFDLGNVLIPLEWHLTEECFEQHGAIFTLENELTLMDLIHDFDAGRIEMQTFRKKFSKTLGVSVNDWEFDKCWCSFVTGLPQENMQLVRELSRFYDVYVLSNLNPIHYAHIKSFKTWDESVFKKVFLSYKLKTKKPEPEIFEKVLAEMPYNPEEIIFFDDKKENIEAAQEFGINAVQVQKDIKDIVSQEVKALTN